MNLHHGCSHTAKSLFPELYHEQFSKAGPQKITALHTNLAPMHYNIPTQLLVYYYFCWKPAYSFRDHSSLDQVLWKPPKGESLGIAAVSFSKGWMPCMSPKQQCQSTGGITFYDLEYFTNHSPKTHGVCQHL